MESVLQQLKQSRKNKNNIQADIHIYETVIEGCQVKMRFNNGNESSSDHSIMESIRSMLLTSRFDSMITAKAGGESS